MLPSALCNRVPIIFSQGSSGSGKSTLGYILCALHGQVPISAGSTFASIRNTIATVRCWDAKVPLEHVGNEKNAALVWEDIGASDLLANDGNIFALLKNGTERSGTISIAELGGTNKIFKVFCPKAISSIHPLYARYEFRELVRRLIVIQHKPRDMWSGEDFDDANRNSTPDELVDLSDLNWDGFQGAFRDYWEDKDVLQRWSSVSRSLAATKNHGIPGTLYKMSRDLICCAVVTGLLPNKEQALEHFRRYWQWHRDNIEAQASATQKALQRFIDEQTALTREANAKLVGTTMEWAIKPVEIDPTALKRHLETLYASGELDTGIQVKEVNAAMNNLGWELRPNTQKRNTWQLINT
jgi:hypothetical protein